MVKIKTIDMKFKIEDEVTIISLSEDDLGVKIGDKVCITEVITEHNVYKVTKDNISIYLGGDEVE